MKKYFAFVLVFVAIVAWAAPNPADYTVDVHVVSSHVKTEFGDKSFTRIRVLNVVISGHKYELSDLVGNSTRVIALGDYKAKDITPESATRSDDPTNAYLIGSRYQLLFPDGKTEKFYLSGVTE